MNILFIDFNGVISYKPFWYSWKDAKNNDYEIIQKVLFGENIELVKERMIGGKTSEEVCLFLADYCSTWYEEILNTLIQDCKTIDISAAIMEQLRRLKPHYHIILATDNMDCFNRWTLPHHPIIAQTFDHIRDSYTHKHPKKEDGWKAFLSMIDERNAKIENCILIDDSKNNCKIFEQIGWQAFALNNENDVLAKLDSIYSTTQNKRLRQF